MARKKVGVPNMGGIQPMMDDDYQGKNDASDLMRAEEIKSDKGRHQNAMKHVRKHFEKAGRVMKQAKVNRFTAQAKLSTKRGKPDWVT